MVNLGEGAIRTVFSIFGPSIFTFLDRSLSHYWTVGFHNFIFLAVHFYTSIPLDCPLFTHRTVHVKSNHD